jgi:peroxiredoxin Q/BCP
VQGVIRSTFLIDPHGKVAHAWPKVAAKGHAAVVLGKLAELRQVQEGV